jgi:hypothetical protein
MLRPRMGEVCGMSGSSGQGGGWSIIESPVNGGSKIKSNTFEGSEMNMAGDMDNLEIVVMA